MKKIAFIFFCILLMRVSAFAASAEDVRGIEEEKRKSLVPTEAQQYPAAAIYEPKLDRENYAFLSGLYNKKVSSIGDACRSISIVLGTEEQFVQENFLPSYIIIKEKSDYQNPLRKGQVAYMLCKALNIKGGLWLRLLGLKQRYALRELVYEGIMFPGNIHDFMSGRELMITLTQTADYLTGTDDK